MRGGKLVRHCVSFRVMRSPSTTIGGGGDQRTDTRGGHYWILDGRLATATTMPRVMMLPPRGRGRGGRRRPIDRLAESPRPRMSKHHRTDNVNEIRRTMPARAPVCGYTIRTTIRSSMIWTKRKVWTMISIFDRSLFPHGIIYYARIIRRHSRRYAFNVFNEVCYGICDK